jgi:hypothetical protein
MKEGSALKKCSCLISGLSEGFRGVEDHLLLFVSGILSVCLTCNSSIAVASTQSLAVR